MNLVILKGNLTRDPELRYTPGGTAVAACGIAINRVWTDQSGNKKEEVDFFDLNFWGKTAETFSQYFRKGKPILVQGRLKLDQWDDKQTGQKRSKVKVVVDRFEFCGGDMGGAPAAAGEAPQQHPNYDAPQADAPESDDVPF